MIRLTVVLSLLGLAMASDMPGQSSDQAPAIPENDSLKRSGGRSREARLKGDEPVARVRREGSRSEELQGSFRMTAGRVEFQDSRTHQVWTVLENLALERVWRAIQTGSHERQWAVTAEFTEYRGKNYLLLKHVMAVTGVSESPSATLESGSATNRH